MGLECGVLAVKAELDEPGLAALKNVSKGQGCHTEKRRVVNLHITECYRIGLCEQSSNYWVRGGFLDPENPPSLEIISPPPTGQRGKPPQPHLCLSPPYHSCVHQG